MDHDLSPEVNELRDMVRTFLERKAPESAVRQTIETGIDRDPEAWSQMAQQLGLHGLLIPEEFGGQGTSFVEMGVVLEEMGRSLLPGPFLASAVLGVSAIIASGDADAAADFLPGIAAGTTVATVAFAHGMTGAIDESTVTASLDAGRWTLDGDVPLVLAGQSADVLLVIAPAGTGRGLFAVDASAPGLTRTLLTSLDETREFARISLAAAPARRLGGDFSAAERTVLALGATAVACEAAGAAQRVLEMAIDYAKLREQFGQPIGSFQAIKHLCADMFVLAESAIAVGRHAARTAATDLAGLEHAASLAKAYSSEACVTAAETNIQVHGGIGYTWEHPAHLYLRKVKSNEFLFGDSATHRALLAAQLGLTATPASTLISSSPSPAPDLAGV